MPWTCFFIRKLYFVFFVIVTAERSTNAYTYIILINLWQDQWEARCYVSQMIESNKRKRLQFGAFFSHANSTNQINELTSWYKPHTCIWTYTIWNIVSFQFEECLESSGDVHRCTWTSFSILHRVIRSEYIPEEVISF